MMRACAVALAALLAAMPGARADPAGLATRLDRTGAGAQLMLYTPGCAEDGEIECAVALLGCEAPGRLSLDVLGLGDTEAGRFVGAGGEGVVELDGARTSLPAATIGRSDLDGSWGASFPADDKAAGLWRALSAAHRLRIVVGPRTTEVALAGRIAHDAREAARVCGGS